MAQHGPTLTILLACFRIKFWLLHTQKSDCCSFFQNSNIELYEPVYNENPQITKLWPQRTHRNRMSWKIAFDSAVATLGRHLKTLDWDVLVHSHSSLPSCSSVLSSIVLWMRSERATSQEPLSQKQSNTIPTAPLRGKKPVPWREFLACSSDQPNRRTLGSLSELTFSGHSIPSLT